MKFLCDADVDRLLVDRRSGLSGEHEVVTLTDRERDRFLELLDNPPTPVDALWRAAQRHRELISESE